jgi:hypothetical protein
MMMGVNCGIKGLGNKLIAMKHILTILIGIEPNIELILYHNFDHIHNLFHLLHNQHHNLVLKIYNRAHNDLNGVVYPRGNHN